MLKFAVLGLYFVLHHESQASVRNILWTYHLQISTTMNWSVPHEGVGFVTYRLRFHFGGGEFICCNGRHKDVSRWIVTMIFPRPHRILGSGVESVGSISVRKTSFLASRFDAFLREALSPWQNATNYERRCVYPGLVIPLRTLEATGTEIRTCS